MQLCRLPAVDAAQVLGAGARRLRFNAEMARTPLSAEATKIVSPVRGVEVFKVEYMLDDVAHVAGTKHLAFCPDRMCWSLAPEADSERVLEALDTRMRHARDQLCPEADTITMVFDPEQGDDMAEFPAGASVALVFERLMPKDAPKNAIFCNVPFPEK